MLTIADKDSRKRHPPRPVELSDLRGCQAAISSWWLPTAEKARDISDYREQKAREQLAKSSRVFTRRSLRAVGTAGMKELNIILKAM